MFESIKQKLAVNFIKRKYISHHGKPVRFTSFAETALDFLVIMPEVDEDFKNSFLVSTFLLSKRKSVTMFISEHRYSIIPERERFRVLSFGPQQVTKMFLPDDALRNKLAQKKFDVVLNLNRVNNVFLNSIPFIVDTNYRVGFKKGEFSDFLNQSCLFGYGDKYAR